MTEKRFDEVIAEICDKIKKTLIVKGKEYRRNKNPFHNFEKAGEMNNTIREKALYGMALKHHVSISDMRNDIENGKLPSIEQVEEKFGDAINYLILEEASIIDRIEKKGKIIECSLNNTSVTHRGYFKNLTINKEFKIYDDPSLERSIKVFPRIFNINFETHTFSTILGNTYNFKIINDEK